MQSYKVMLMGHRDLYRYNRLEEKLYSLFKALMLKKEFVEIYVGRNGDFDLIAATAVRRAQKAVGRENSAMILVFPAQMKNFSVYGCDYDNTVAIEGLRGFYLIDKQNRWMVEQCDLLVCYAEHEKDGILTALKHAERLHKEVINLAVRQRRAQGESPVK